MKLEWGPKRSRDFGYYHFRMSCPGLWTAVETWRRAVQLCPDRHPAVSSMALWGAVQNYPACLVASGFADVNIRKYVFVGFCVLESLAVMVFEPLGLVYPLASGCFELFKLNCFTMGFIYPVVYLCISIFECVLAFVFKLSIITIIILNHSILQTIVLTSI